MAENERLINYDQVDKLDLLKLTQRKEGIYVTTTAEFDFETLVKLQDAKTRQQTAREIFKEIENNLAGSLPTNDAYEDGDFAVYNEDWQALKARYLEGK